MDGYRFCTEGVGRNIWVVREVLRGRMIFYCFFCGLCGGCLEVVGFRIGFCCVG